MVKANPPKRGVDHSIKRLEQSLADQHELDRMGVVVGTHTVTVQASDLRRLLDAFKAADHERADLLVEHGVAVAAYRLSEGLRKSQGERLAPAEAALTKINAIRNSIVGLQTINWSEHVYPLVAALNEAGYSAMQYEDAKQHYGTMLERTVRLENLETAVKGHV